MSTELGYVKGITGKVWLTRFCSNSEVCVQITQQSPDGARWVQLTASQLKAFMPLLQQGIVDYAEEKNISELIHSDEWVENLVDCPICGSKKTMEWKKTDMPISLPDKDPIIVTDLEGNFCTSCGEGFLNEASKQEFNERLNEYKNG